MERNSKSVCNEMPNEQKIIKRIHDINVAKVSNRSG